MAHSLDWASRDSGLGSRNLWGNPGLTLQKDDITGLGGAGSVWNGTSAAAAKSLQGSSVWQGLDVSSTKSSNGKGWEGSGDALDITAVSSSAVGIQDGNLKSNSSQTNDSVNNWERSGSISSGWGSLESGPMSNTGIESWGMNKHSSSDWGQQDGGRTTPSESEMRSNNDCAMTASNSNLAEITGEDRPKQSPWNTCSGDDASGSTESQAGRMNQSNINSTSSLGTSPQGVWGKGNPLASQATSPSVGGTGLQGQLGSWAQAAVKGLDAIENKTEICNKTESTSEEVGDPEALVSRTPEEEYIFKAINSSEGWGKIPVRQDTPWNIEEPELRRLVPPQHEITGAGDAGDAHSWQATTTGTSLWESTRGNSGGCAPTPAGTPLNGPMAPLSVGGNALSAFRPPLEKPKQLENQWGVGSASGDGGSFLERGAGKPNSIETGTWEHGQHARQRSSSSSASSWAGDDSDGSGWGDDNSSHQQDIDVGTSFWGDPSGGPSRSANWNRPGNRTPSIEQQMISLKMKQDEKNKSFFDVRPPSINSKSGGWGDQMESGPSSWNSSLQPVNY